MVRTIVAMLVVASVGLAEEISSGPGAGSYMPGPFRVLCVVHEQSGRVGKFHSPVCEHGLNPTVLIFARQLGEVDQPLGQLVRKLDELVGKNPDVNLGAAVVLLNDGGYRDALEKPTKEDAMSNAIKAKRELVGKAEAFAKAAGLSHVALYLDRTQGPKDLGLNAEAEVTILICHKHKVVVNVALKKDALSEEALDQVAKDVAALVAEVELLIRPKKKPRG